MKPRNLMIGAFLAAGIGAHAAPQLIPNGDFSSGITSWVTATDGPTIFDTPPTGGNPDGYASMEFTTGGYAVLVSDSVTIASLGLTAGETYEFSMDMIDLASGGGTGGLKIDFPGATPASTGDIRPTVIGDGSTWEKYIFTITVPADATNAVFVPLWGGANTTIGYDNVGVDDTPVTPITDIPNKGFETPAGAEWAESSGGGTFVYSYPTTGGNPDGFGQIDHSAADGGFGVLVTNNEQTIPLSGLGLDAGKSYVFSQDMKIISGSNLGGFKVDFFNGAATNGSTGDIFPALIGDGSTWEKYDFTVAIPAGTTGIRVVPLWGADSTVGYDNVIFDPTEVVPPGIVEIPNGDFEAGNAGWAEVGAPNTTYSYPGSGGNPDGYGVMTNDGGGFGIWVANSDTLIPLDGLGLVAGELYKFSQDMIILSGSNVGGLKIDFFTGAAQNGSTGDMFPAVQGDGSTWATYDFDVPIPAGTDGIKVVPLWGSGSSVGYDNITFDPTAIITEIPNGDFEIAGGESWAEGGAPNTVFTYPATGGNGGGYGLMTNDGGGYGIWIANDNDVIPLEGLGLTAGEAYEFLVDMIIESGSNLGGMKIDFFAGAGAIGSTGDIFPALIGDGSTWETYSFQIPIPAAADGIKVVPLWGSGSAVGFDNITFNPAPLDLPLIPNGDFENGGASWSFVQSGGHLDSFTGSGGNPDGYASINSVGQTGFSVLVANNNTPMQLVDLGLTAGETYIFKVDMRLFAGTTIGGMAVDFVPGSTGDMFPPALIGDGSTWETYEFEVTIPENTTQIFVKLLWGDNSEVGFDNVDIVIPSEAPLTAEIKTGTAVTWVPEFEYSQYQAQRSTNGGSTWANVGDPIIGTSSNVAFDPLGPPATYQVVESDAPTLENAVLNAGFETTETPIYPSPGAPEWSIASPEDTDPLDGTASMLVGGTYESVDPFEGSSMLVIESTTPPAPDAVVPPNTDIRSGFNPVLGDVEYTITFQAAHPVKIGGANPQFNIFFYDGDLNPVGGPIFESFAAVGSDWELVEKTFTPPTGTEWMTIGWIQAMGAGNDWRWVTLIDDVSLPVTTGGGGNEFILPASTAPGIAICWDTELDVNYQVKCSTDLSNFTDFGPLIPGTGSTASLADVIAPGGKFYRVESTPAE